MTMNNQQLTEMAKQINAQIMTMPQMQERMDEAQQATAQAPAELTAATDCATAALDSRIQACEDLGGASKRELADAQKQDRDMQFRVIGLKASAPNKFTGNRKAWRSWACTMKAYLSSQYRGARNAM